METVTKIVSAGQAMLSNDMKPVSSICAHVCAFHFYADDMNRQVEAHHYCSHGRDGMLQCVIYDKNASDAKLIGIEYIIPKEKYDTLDAEEQRYWHSHVFEVQSGLLYQPAGNAKADLPHMEMLINSYGKTWHTWQADRGDELPLGIPQLMMAFLEEGQIKPELVEKRDKECGKTTADCKAARSHLQHPVEEHPSANHWTKGQGAWQTSMLKVPFKPLKRSASA